MMLSGRLFGLQMSERHTEERGGSCWLTPRAGNPGSRPNKKGGKILAEEVKKKELFPTPTSSDGTSATVLNENTNIYFLKSGNPRKISNQGVDGSVGLSRYVKIMYPTPSKSDVEGGRHDVEQTESGHWRRISKTTGIAFGAKLRDAIETGEERKMYPTATARDWKGSTAKRREQGNPKRALDCEVEMYGDKTPQTSTLRLSPTWVEWLMGLPPRWTVLSGDIRREFIATAKTRSGSKDSNV